MGFVRALAPPVLPTPYNVAYNRAEAAASPRGEFLAILWQKVPPQGQGRVLTSLDRTSQIPIRHRGHALGRTGPHERSGGVATRKARRFGPTPISFSTRWPIVGPSGELGAQGKGRAPSTGPRPLYSS
jgi:hypothetical protein